MSNETDHAEMVRAYLAAIETGDAERVGALLHPEAEQTEYPSMLNPKGQVRRREAMLADLQRGATMLQSQNYAIKSIIAVGDQVAVEVIWRGVLAVTVGGLRAGEAMVAHIAMVVEFKDGRIHRQRNYDCFDAFPAA